MFSGSGSGCVVVDTASLLKLIHRYAPHAMEPTHISHFTGQRIAVDASLFITRFLLASMGDSSRGGAAFSGSSTIYGGSVEEDDDVDFPTNDSTTTHPEFPESLAEFPEPHVGTPQYLLQLNRFSEWFSTNGVEPVFIFDNKTKLQEKSHEHKRRETLRDKAAHEFQLVRESMQHWDSVMRALDGDREDEVLLSMREHGIKGRPSSLEISRPRQRIFVDEEKLWARLATYADASTLHRQEERSTLQMQIHSFTLRLHLERMRLLQRMTRPSAQEVDACRRCLESRGHLVLEAQHESEALCAALTDDGVTAAAMSDDSDTIVFGKKGLVLKNGFRQDRAMQQVHPGLVREGLELTESQFLDLCILCGTDFSGTITNIGSQRALRLIREYGTIERVLVALQERAVPWLSKHGRFTPHATFQHEEARSLFQAKMDLTDYTDRIQAHQPKSPLFSHGSQ